MDRSGKFDRGEKYSRGERAIIQQVLKKGKKAAATQKMKYQDSASVKCDTGIIRGYTIFIFYQQKSPQQTKRFLPF